MEREEQEFTEEVFRVFKREDAETGPFYPADSCLRRSGDVLLVCCDLVCSLVSDPVYFLLFKTYSNDN